MRQDDSCHIEACPKFAMTSGLCSAHYDLWRKYRDPYWRERKPFHSEYFWSKISKQPDGGCWIWTGTLNDAGYGRYNGRRAHRICYELVRGPIPQDLVLDHMCRVRRCVNPDHLRAVTLSVNSIENNVGVATANRAKTSCPRGHPYDTLRRRPNGSLVRGCKRCHAKGERERRQRK